MTETTSGAAARPYHHGDLKAALLAEAERILERDGLPALTLRATARGAGVSHAAPKNHFGDLTGLLSELAALGYGRFNRALRQAMDSAGDDPRDRITAMGRAYVGFGRAHPGLFTLMFRNDRLDPRRPALQAELEAAGNMLRGAIAARQGQQLSPLQSSAQGTALWSLVHGFVTLLLDGRLDNVLPSLPSEKRADMLLDAVLSVVRVGR